MSHRFIAQLGERENLEQVFLASEKQLRTNKSGNYYLQMRLIDRTGAVNAMMWNANDSVYKSFENGDYVTITGSTQFYNGNMQIIVTHIHRADPSQVDEANFRQLSNRDIDHQAARMRELLRAMKNPHLLNLADCFLMDEEIMDRLMRAPAGLKNHHAYPGGLLEHIVSLMETTQLIAPRYPEMDAEMLLLGAFLHDIGKINELFYDRDQGYTDEGQLIGHVVMAIGMIDGKIRESEKLSGEPFPEELALRVKHLVLSHHGEYEFGSPKLPMTLEAITLHYLDNMDAKIHSFLQIMQNDPNTDSNWTTYQPGLQRKLFKGAGGK